MRFFIFLLMVFMLALPAKAVNPDEVLTDPVLEQRAREISTKLRCLVCQNQSIDDSDAQLAKDLRVLVRERLTAGDDDTAVVDFVVDRYGEYVLLKPRLGGHTLLLWSSPFVAFGFGLLALFFLRRRSDEDAAAAAQLSNEEEAALNQILNKRD
ncbi:MAG: cytochrome c-type biogenesis protein [Hyphomicrobiales bacterium]